MPHIKALSLALDVEEWLANSHRPRVLHIFDQACNLINERKDVLSIVTPQIGNGPFNLVLEDEVVFSRHLDVRSEIAVQKEQLVLDDLIVNTGGAKLWQPRPDWDELHLLRREIISRLTSPSFDVQGPSLPDSLLSAFIKSIVTDNISLTLVSVQKLAGLGIGLTPAGDDFIMGALYATWIIHPPEIAKGLVEGIAESVAPLTTSLSAAWIKSAGRGEAGQVWHDLFDALLSADKMAIEKSIEKILDVGHTSGADALAGFLGVFNSCVESL